MVSYCCAYGCKNRYVKGVTITFHRFPANPKRRKLWTLALRRKNFVPSNTTVICSEHFTEDDYDKNKLGGSWLKSNAVPSKFVFTEQTSVHHKPPIIKEVNIFNRSITNENNSENVLCFPKIKTFRYVGDFKDDDDDELTDTSRLRWELAKKRISYQQKTIKSLRESIRRLKKKESSLKEIVADLKNKKIGKTVQAQFQKEKAKDFKEADLVLNDENSSNKLVTAIYSESNFIKENNK